jgi:hypothetical protein
MSTMTQRKHLKQLVRARMQRTGESYTTARRQIIGQHLTPAAPTHRFQHFPGSVPVSTALRVLLANAGVQAPHTNQPFSEAMVFGLAGGIGAGMFTFVYEKEDFASFYVAGVHGWQDTAAYFRQACRNLGLDLVVSETAGARAAEQTLQETLRARGPCIAWVDMVHLPHRGLPIQLSGGGYHVIAVYEIDEHTQTALIGDMTDEPIVLPLADLATARGRIKKDKHRLLSLPSSPSPTNLGELVRQGLKQCQDGLTKQRMKNFTLEAFRVWAERMHGSKDQESWERIFSPGPRLWQGLMSIYDYVEHSGTGGGLCRPLFADFLRETGEALGDTRLAFLAERYREIARNWTALANAALPEDVPAFRRAKELITSKSERMHSGAQLDEIHEACGQCFRLKREEPFPLSEAEAAALRADLKVRILELYEAEKAALAALI